MTVKKIRFSEEKQNTKEKEKLKFSREKLLDLSRKKTFKATFLPNINSIKNEVNNFKREREKWKKRDNEPNTNKEKNKAKEAEPLKSNVIITSKKTKIKKDKQMSRYNSKKFKNPKIQKPILKRKNTKKLNEIEIIVLFKHLCDLLERNRIDKISGILKKTKRKQIVQILNYFNIFKEDTSAPMPLLKNVLFNLLFDDLDIN